MRFPPPSLMAIALSSVTPRARGSDDGGWQDLRVRHLRNANFARGTYRIRRPGRYVLTEDISFRPNTALRAGTSPEDVTPDDVAGCCRPTPEQRRRGPYSDDAYVMGFFAAITIEVPNVEIDLGGHTLEQSAEHALVQRFFALIELNDRPFIPGQGPADFGRDAISAATDVRIRNGALGRSSHHGVHGNGNRRVVIRDVRFDGFEVAAVALNGVSGLTVRDCTARSRRDVPVTAVFSSAVFIYGLVRELDESGSSIRLEAPGGAAKTAGDVRRSLEESIRNAYVDVTLGGGLIDPAAHPLEYGLFHNPSGVLDGNCYGFLTNPLGVAVEGFPLFPGGAGPSSSVLFKNVTVSDLACAVDEVVGLRVAGDDGGGKPVNDAFGALVQLRNADPDTGAPLTVTTLEDDDAAAYVGNPVSDAQILVGKAVLAGEIEGTKSTVPQDLVDWAEGRMGSLSDLVASLSPDADTGYICNGDSMAHVNKGIVGFKLDGTKRAVAQSCAVRNAVNLGKPGSPLCGPYYSSSVPGSTYPGYNGANARGFSVAGSRQVKLDGCDVSGLISADGMAVGYDVHTDSSKVRIRRCTGEGVSAPGVGGPTTLCPHDATVVRLGEDTSRCFVQGNCFGEPDAPGGVATTVVDEGRKNRVVEVGRGCPFWNAQR